MTAPAFTKFDPRAFLENEKQEGAHRESCESTGTGAETKSNFRNFHNFRRRAG